MAKRAGTRGRSHPTIRQRPSAVERLEERTLTTLVFVLNGNSLAATGPDSLTANAAAVLDQTGNQAVQISTPAMQTRGAFEKLVRGIEAVSQGQPIGIVGFSAGGVVGLRLATIPALNVVDVLDYYGPPDLRDYFAYHHNDFYARSVKSHIRATQTVLDLFSGPGVTSAHLVAAFGLNDGGVVAWVSTASMDKDFPGGQVYDYNGGHGAQITASRPALEDFLSHL